MITIEHKVHFGNGRRSRQELRQGDAPPEAPHGRVPRVTKLMALAVRLDRLIHDRVVTHQAEFARLGRVSRARLTQIMNWLILVLDIQEAILVLPATKRRRDVVTEKQLRPIAAVPDWGGREGFGRVRSSPAARFSGINDFNNPMQPPTPT